MKEFKGTPGPWKFVNHNHCTKKTGQGQRYGVLAHVIDFNNREKDRWVFNIALDKTEDLDIHREADANARLIAAAPELLEALQILLFDFESVVKNPGSQPSVMIAKDVLKKL